MAGSLTIGGAAAPVGTIVSLAFDGVVGPGGPTRAAGGYAIDFSFGGSDCANRIGAAISVFVNGKLYGTGAVVSAEPFVLANIAAE